MDAHSEAAPQSIVSDAFGSSSADVMMIDHSLTHHGDYNFINAANEGFKLSENSCFSIDMELNQSLGEICKNTASGVQNSAALTKKR